ncbi:MAG: 1-phosphofructokinase family hexose kinase [Clostridia bacterium]|nr:1-phosphofructokinase family hexose kinase [Clostridia bacterium]
MIYTLTLNPALDYTMRFSHVVRGTVNRADTVRITPGGKGINVSLVLARLGIPNVALGFLAGSTGRELERLLQEEGVTTGFVVLPEGQTRINVKLFDPDQLDLNAPGPDLTEAGLTTLRETLSHLQPEDTLVLSGALPGSAPQDLYERILEELPPDVTVVVDTTGEALSRTLSFHPFLVKPNWQELQELFGVETPSFESEETWNLTEQLQRRGAENVLVSGGGDGALLLDRTGERHFLPPASGQLIGDVGCGDSMVAGFLAGFAHTGDYSMAFRLGAAAGAATAFSEDLGDRALICSIFHREEPQW